MFAIEWLSVDFPFICKFYKNLFICMELCYPITKNKILGEMKDCFLYCKIFWVMKSPFNLSFDIIVNLCSIWRLCHEKWRESKFWWNMRATVIKRLPAYKNLSVFHFISINQSIIYFGLNSHTIKLTVNPVAYKNLQ